MDCNRARIALHAWLEGELDRSGAAEIEQHLRTCAACARQAGQLRRLFAGLERLAELDPLPVAKCPPGRSRPYGVVVTGRLLRFAAAIVIAAGLGLFGWLAGPPVHFQARVAAPGAAVAAAVDVKLIDESNEQYLAVALPSSRANVRIVRLFEVASATK